MLVHNYYAIFWHSKTAIHLKAAREFAHLEAKLYSPSMMRRGSANLVNEMTK